MTPSLPSSSHKEFSNRQGQLSWGPRSESGEGVKASPLDSVSFPWVQKPLCVRLLRWQKGDEAVARQTDSKK